MSKFVLVSTYLGLNGVDRSSWCSKVEVAVEVEAKDVTVFTSAGWKEVLGGLKSGNMAITFKNDVADGLLDDTMWTLLGTVVTFEVRPTSSVVGTSNPKFTGSVLISGWTPISGSPGDVAEVSVTFPTSGAVTRAEA
jgi:hypothetical protein